MKPAIRKRVKDPMLTLINIIFLILIFFMIAGSLSQAPHKDLTFVQSDAADCCTQPDGVIILKDGSLFYGQKPVASLTAMNIILQDDEKTSLKLIPDKDLPAYQLLDIIQQLRDLKLGPIMIVTEMEQQS